LIFRKTLFYSFLGRVHVFGGQQTKSGVKQFLPNLESLTIDGDVSLCLIESLLTSVAKLKALTICYINRQLTNFNFAAAAAAAADDDDDQVIFWVTNALFHEKYAFK